MSILSVSSIVPLGYCVATYVPSQHSRCSFRLQSRPSTKFGQLDAAANHPRNYRPIVRQYFYHRAMYVDVSVSEHSPIAAEFTPPLVSRSVAQTQMGRVYPLLSSSHGCTCSLPVGFRTPIGQGISCSRAFSMDQTTCVLC